MKLWTALLALLLLPMTTAQSAPETSPVPLLLPLPPGLVMPTSHQSALPPLAWSDGLGPGAQIYMDFEGTGSPQFLCTSNYVWKDQNGVLYLGAAGHCFLPPDTTATVNAGPDGDVGPGEPGSKNSTKHNFWACWQDCLAGGIAGDTLRDTVIQGAVKLGAVAYARQTQDGKDIGRDFGLITIPRELYADARPSVPVWGRPVGETATQPGDAIVLHGNGLWDGESFATKSRSGVSLGDNGDGSFSAAIKSSGGDSGSAILAPTSFGEVQAVGLLTHGNQVPLLGYGLGTISGTTVTQAKAMARQAHLCIAIMEPGEDPLAVTPAPADASCGLQPPGNPELVITSPSDGQAVPAGNLTVSGTVDRLAAIPLPLGNARIVSPGGARGSAIPVAATATGGTAPYSCQWFSDGGAFADAGRCSTTVTFGTPGPKTLELTLVDGASPPATLTATLAIMVTAQPAPVCIQDAPDDAHGPISVTDPVGIYEITRACGQTLLDDRTLQVAMDITGLSFENFAGNAAGPAIYTTFVAGIPGGWEAYHAAGAWQVWNTNANARSAATASSNDTTLTVRIPFAELGPPGYAPTSFRVHSGVGVGLAGSSKATMDAAPDQGDSPAFEPAHGVPARRLSAPVAPPASVPPDPEVTDPDGDVTGIGTLGLPTDGTLAGLPIDALDIQAAWFHADGDALFAGLRVKSIPPDASQVSYAIDFRPGWTHAWPIPAEDTFDSLRLRALWDRTTGPGTAFELQALSHAVVGGQRANHFTPLASLPGSSLDAARGVLWFVAPRALLHVPEAGGTLTDLGAVTVPAAAGATMGTFFGDTATSARAVTVPPTFHAILTAPGTAAVGQPVQLHAEGVAGTAPYACAWSSPDATFANPGTSPAACSTTATFATTGAKAITATVTDGSTPHRTAQATAAILVVNPERVELYDAGAWVATALVTTDPTHPRGAWSASVPLATPGGHTLTAKWLDQDATAPLAVDAVLVTVLPPNQPPKLDVAGNSTAAEGQVLALTVTASDPDGDAVMLSADSLPAGAAFDAASGHFTWQISFDQAGTHTVVFSARDSHGASTGASVAIAVADSNRPPALETVPGMAVKARTTLRFTAHATDPDGQAVTYSANALPPGAALDAASGEFSWTPTRQQIGSYDIVVTASDGQLSSQTTAHITVTKH